MSEKKKIPKYIGRLMAYPTQKLSHYMKPLLEKDLRVLGEKVLKKYPGKSPFHILIMTYSLSVHTHGLLFQNQRKY